MYPPEDFFLLMVEPQGPLDLDKDLPPAPEAPSKRCPSPAPSTSTASTTSTSPTTPNPTPQKYPLPLPAPPIHQQIFPMPPLLTNTPNGPFFSQMLAQLPPHSSAASTALPKLFAPPIPMPAMPYQLPFNPHMPFSIASISSSTAPMPIQFPATVELPVKASTSKPTPPPPPPPPPAAPKVDAREKRKRKIAKMRKESPVWEYIVQRRPFFLLVRKVDGVAAIFREIERLFPLGCGMARVELIELVDKSTPSAQENFEAPPVLEAECLELKFPEDCQPAAKKRRLKTVQS
ncbi:unnamed protein product, partial [Mesorhabditis spiculigera]